MTDFLDRQGLVEKSKGSAVALVNEFKVSPDKAFQITSVIWSEVRRIILSTVSPQEWRGLSVAEKSEITSEIVTALFNKGKVQDFLNGSRSSLI